MKRAVFWKVVLLLFCLSLITGIATVWESSTVQNLKRTDPGAYETYLSEMKKGDALMRQGRADLAWASYDTANKLAPNDPASLAALGNVSLARGYPDNAEAYFNQADKQLLIDHEAGVVSEYDDWDFMARLSEERIAAANLQLQRCGSDQACSNKYQADLSEARADLVYYNDLLAEDIAGVPEPVFGVVAGLTCAVVLVAWKGRRGRS